MGYTHYSTPINTTPVYEPLPLEAIMQGNKAVYDRGEKNVQKIQGLIDSAYSLPSLQGKDTEVKNQIIQSYMDNVSQLAKGNLTDPKTAAQIESYISRVTRDPQIAGIVGRATFAAQEEKKRAEAEAKGERYTCPGCKEAAKYINDGVFIADKKFNQSGWATPKFSKHLAEADKMTDVEETPVYNSKTGEWTIVKRKDPAKLKSNFLLSLGDDPNVEKELQLSFNEKYSDLDWETEGRNKLASDISNLQSEIYLAESQGLDASPYKAALQEYQQIYNNPSLLGEPLKNNIYQIEREDFINSALKGAEAMSTGIPQLSDLSKLNRQFAQQKSLLLLKDQQKQAQKKQIEDKVKNSVLQAAYKRAMDLGYDVFDSQGNLVPEEVLNSYGLGKPVKEKEEKPKDVVKEDIASFRNLFSKNSGAIKKAIENKLETGLGVGGFSEADIEKLEWNKDTNRYEVEIDDSWYGGNEKISFTQDEINNLKNITYKKDNEIITIPLDDPDAEAAIEEAEELGYKKQE